MLIDELTVGIVQTCCYILGREDGQECIVIDPGAEANRIRKHNADKGIAAAGCPIYCAYLNVLLMPLVHKQQH